jgi:hypothetical protein
MTNNSATIISFILLFLIIIGIIVYVIVIFEMWKGNKGLFAPYTPPPAPANSFYPLSDVLPDTPEQAATKQNLAEQMNSL